MSSAAIVGGKKIKITNKDYKNFIQAAFTRLPEIRARVKFIYLRRKPDIVKEYVAVAAQMTTGGKLSWFCEAGFSDVDDAVIDYVAVKCSTAKRFCR
ncbi:MAG: hypothetical protein ACKO0Z_07595 [Betaproteobacteria bacterium]